MENKKDVKEPSNLLYTEPMIIMQWNFLRKKGLRWKGFLFMIPNKILFQWRA